MKYDIRFYGDPVLREKSIAVKVIDDDILQLADDMIDTMHANNGVGLAAQQIGRTERICIVNIDDEMRADERSGCEDVEMPMILINPEIGELSSEKISATEGCLSFPDIFVNIERAAGLKLKYMDLSGTDHDITVTGFLARAVQHEIDHLNAMLLVDHMSPVQKVAVAGKLKRLKKQASECK